MSFRHGMVAALLLAVVAVPALAIEVGDPAPPLQIKHWVKGEPVDLKEGKGKNIYVIEFWGTWCRPCITGIPHLTELQKKYKDKGVVLISISSSDKDLKTVEKFVNKRGDEMGYTIAYEDKKTRPTSKAYMDAFAQRGIPHAFVIDRQDRIAWHGHPNYLDEPLKEIIAGQYDLEKAKKHFAKERKLAEARKKSLGLVRRYFDTIESSKNAEQANKLAKEIMPLIEEDALLLNMFSWAILTNEDLLYRDLDLALRTARMANDLTEGKDPATLDTYARALWDTGKKKQAIRYQRKAVELCETEGMKADLEKILRGYERRIDK